LTQALKRTRHLRSRLVLCQRDGSPLTHNMVADHVRRAARRSGTCISVRQRWIVRFGCLKSLPMATPWQRPRARVLS